VEHAGHARTPEAYDRDLRTLAAFEDPALVQRTAEYAISPEVRPQDVLFLLTPLMRNPAARHATWTFIQQHWEAVAARLDNYSTGPLVASMRSFCDGSDRDSVEHFFQAHPLPAAERTLRQSIEGINNCIDLRQQQSPRLAAWLHDHSAVSSASGGSR
jgi:aminopeptidase N/puromycin-sensitive aminopeptidase